MVRDRVSGNVSSIVLPLTIVLGDQVDLVFSFAIRFPRPRPQPQRVSACVPACLRVWASACLGVSASFVLLTIAQTVSEVGAGLDWWNNEMDLMDAGFRRQDAVLARE